MPRKRGFATLSPAQRIAVSRKGGQARVKKGFASQSQEFRVEAGRKGGRARWDNQERKEEDGKDSISSGNASDHQGQ